MATHPLAGKPAPAELLIDPSKLERDYYTRQPDLANPNQLVSFGTSGHRGTPLDGTFTEAHILAITQATCEYRHGQGFTGPLFMGKDTHAASTPAQRTALEVLAANGVETIIQSNDGFTPTPVISRAILVHNRGRKDGFADGLIITPSHNPPNDGGMKYNPPNGGPADTDYVKDLSSVIDLAAIRSAGLKIGVDPLGGPAVNYWDPLRREYGLNLTIVNPNVDPTFSFMTVDHDGKIRMDCSSPFAMAGLVKLKAQHRVRYPTRHCIRPISLPQSLT